MRRVLTRHLPPACSWRVLAHRILHHVPEPLLLRIVATIGADADSGAWPPASQLLLRNVQWQAMDELLLAAALLCHGHTLERRLLERRLEADQPRAPSEAEADTAAVHAPQPTAAATTCDHADEQPPDDASPNLPVASSMRAVAQRLCADANVREAHWSLRIKHKGEQLRMLFALEWWALGLQLHAALTEVAPSPAEVCIDGAVARRSAPSPARGTRHKKHKKQHKKKHKKRRRSSSDEGGEVGREGVWSYTPPGLDQAVVLDGRALQTAVQQQALLAWLQWIVERQRGD